jgi:hypothetical protein
VLAAFGWGYEPADDPEAHHAHVAHAGDDGHGDGDEPHDGDEPRDGDGDGGEPVAVSAAEPPSGATTEEASE